MPALRYYSRKAVFFRFDEVVLACLFLLKTQNVLKMCRKGDKTVIFVTKFKKKYDFCFIFSEEYCIIIK